MPNGGSDCCGTCINNRANRDNRKNTGQDYCLLRGVAITTPYWTYCDNWCSPSQGRIKAEPYGPMYGSGIYERGYVRIPWNGRHEPETYMSGQCFVTGEVFEEKGIRVYDDEAGGDLFFAGNREYYHWYENRHNSMPLPFRFVPHDNYPAGDSDLHRIYTELFARRHLAVDFIHCGRDIVLPPADDADTLVRIQGALVGGAVGDALGRVVESQNPGHKDVERYVPWRGWKSGPQGTITDDTQMTMWLAESLVTNGGLLPDDAASRFVRYHIRGIGKATRDFVRNYKDRKMPWYNAGLPSSGNGAAMRAAPVGLYYRKDPEEIKLAAGIQAMITHNDSMAIASSIVMACAAAYLVTAKKGWLETLERRIEFCRELASVIAGIEDGREYRCRQTARPDTLYRRIGETIPACLEQGMTPAAVQQDFWSGAYVLESLPFALYCFLYSPDDFRQTLLTAVNESRDSDTVAAMACTLSGAYNGVDAIPEYYRDPANLEYQAELMELGRRLWQG